MNPYLLAIFAYAAFLTGLGFWAARRTTSSEDFLVANRSLGPGALFATFLAANIGASATVGDAGLGYRYGLGAWWWVGSAAIGSFVLANLAGPRIWQIAKTYNLSTLGDYLQHRYHPAVKSLIVALLLIGTLALLAGQLLAISTILTAVTGSPKWLGCTIGGLVAIIYCAGGGLKASAFVNRFELVVTMGGLLLSVPFALHHIGGWSHIVSAVQSQGHPSQLNLLGNPHQILTYIFLLTPAFICSPGLLQKTYSARSGQAVRLGITANATAQLIFAVFPPIIGLCAFTAFPHLANPELALPLALKTLLPKWLGMWALASIFSAELSATDAILLMLSSSLAVDIYQRFLRPQTSAAYLLRASRITAVLAGAAGILLALRLPTVIAAASIFYGLLSVSLFIPLLFGLYTRSARTATALIAIVAAIAVTYSLILTQPKGIGPLSPQACGILASLLIMSTLTLLQKHFATAKK